MVELFEQDIKTSERQSSKGNQLKWENNHLWYKADYTGYEGLAEYVISHLLEKTSLAPNEYVLYEPVQIRYKKQIYTGVSSQDFLKPGWQIVTLERLFQITLGTSLNRAIWSTAEHKNRLTYLVQQVERVTGLNEFGKYMNKVLTIDAFFLNEDRHTHNLAVLMSDKGEFDYCPIFDNGAGLLADITMDYPMDGDAYELIDDVRGKTFSTDLEEQMDISEVLYDMNLKLHFTKKNVERLLALDGSESEICIYPVEMRKRVQMVIYEQMRKYPYLFANT